MAPADDAVRIDALHPAARYRHHQHPGHDAKDVATLRRDTSPKRWPIRSACAPMPRSPISDTLKGSSAPMRWPVPHSCLNDFRSRRIRPRAHRRPLQRHGAEVQRLPTKCPIPISDHRRAVFRLDPVNQSELEKLISSLAARGKEDIDRPTRCSMPSGSRTPRRDGTRPAQKIEGTLEEARALLPASASIECGSRPRFLDGAQASSR